MKILQDVNDYIRWKIFSFRNRSFKTSKELYRLEMMIGPIGHWDRITKYHFTLLTLSGLDPHHTLLDIGCGPLPTGQVIIPYLDPGNYVGIDIAPECIEEAQRRVEQLGLSGKRPTLLVSDSFGRDELGERTFDYIIASQVVYHFDPHTVEEFMRQMAVRMRPGSKLMFDVIGYPNRISDTSTWNGYTFHLHEPAFLEAMGDRFDLGMKNLGVIERYGYPAEVQLKTNLMLEFTMRGNGKG